MENITPQPVSPYLVTLAESVHYAPAGDKEINPFSPFVEKEAEKDDD